MSQDLPSYPARQTRSQQTLERLLDAAESLLGEGGLAAATVPLIAERAGVSVGIIYRRFPDKDALLRSVYLRFFDRSLAQNREALSAEKWVGIPLGRMLHLLIRGMVAGYELNRPLLRALFLYADTHADGEFRHRADELSGETLHSVGELLLRKTEEIGHPYPRMAVPFVLEVIRSTLRSYAMDDGPNGRLGASGEDLSAELTRLVGGYLGLRAHGP